MNISCASPHPPPPGPYRQFIRATPVEPLHGAPPMPGVDHIILTSTDPQPLTLPASVPPDFNVDQNPAPAEGIPAHGVPPGFSVHQNPAVGIPAKAYGYGGGQPLPFSGAHPPLQTMGMGPTRPHLPGSVESGFPAPAYGGGGQPAPLPPKHSAGTFLSNCLNVIRCCNTLEDCYRLNGGCCAGDCGNQEW